MNENQTFISIKDWSLQDRPREKLLNRGKVALTNSELLAVLIGTGNKNESAVALSQRILSSVDNDLNTLGKLSIPQLKKFKGVGEAKAISVIAALELGRRHKLCEEPVQVITSSRDVYNHMSVELGALGHEEFWIILLNNSNAIITKLQLSKGGISSTIIDIRILAKMAIEYSAVSVILCHNHPSGNLEPSHQDKLITNKIQEALKILDIKVLDHVILTENAYFSFADEAIL